MSLDNYKITKYEDNVSDLPDYPSDAGYTAAQLKAVFDGRTDKEIKEKFNALIDELKTRFNDVTLEILNEVQAHNGDDIAHLNLFNEVRNLISEKLGKTEFENYMSAIDGILTGKADVSDVYSITEIDNMLNGKVDKVPGKGLSSNDFTDEDVQDLFEARSKASGAYQDISIHKAAIANPHNVTAEQVGAYTKEKADEKFVDKETYQSDIGFYDKVIFDNVDDIEELKGDMGDISTALDELHTYAQALVNGGAE